MNIKIKIIIIALVVLCLCSIRLNISTFSSINELTDKQSACADSIRLLKSEIKTLKAQKGIVAPARSLREK